MKKTNTASLLFGCLGMLVLILDGRTAITGIRAGLEICLRTLIPSLFPFFLLSALVTGGLVGRSVGFLTGIGRICQIPTGAESLFAIGVLGGYPVGAKNISDALKRKKISLQDAQRLTIFCNNAGPSFLFGILGQMFSGLHWVWTLWFIQIISAIMTGMLLPGGSRKTASTREGSTVSLPDALNCAIKSIAQVSGWVIIFRMVLEFLNRWFLWLLPIPAQVLFTGILELSNGCLCLQSIDHEALRFLFASIILSLGGICIWMQTKSVFPQLDMTFYLTGKGFQSLISLFLSVAVIPLLTGTSSGVYPLMALISLLGVLALVLFSRIRKKEVAIP